ncbi:MAG: hypothetical protein QM813_21405 [Verrucomicrobiota bacterium]
MNGSFIRRLKLALLILSSATPWLFASPSAAEILPPGFRPKPVGVHALVGGKVVTKPGETLDDATVIIRDGYIEAVGKNISVPADARVWDSKGLTIYAGFIEPYLSARSNQPSDFDWRY